MDLGKISNCDTDYALTARELLPSVRETLSEQLPCAGSEVTKTDRANQRSSLYDAPAEGWRQMCEKITRAPWASAISERCIKS